MESGFEIPRKSPRTADESASLTYKPRALPLYQEPKSRKDMEQRKFSERDFPALVEARRYTELLRSMETGRDALLAFPDGRSLDSFRQTAYRENMRGDGPVCYRLRINWPQRVANVKPVTREEYEREKRSGLDT